MKGVSFGFAGQGSAIMRGAMVSGEWECWQPPLKSRSLKQRNHNKMQ